ncbi:MAG: MFS transporter [Bauldia sp.]|nr:MFS transporter [Bauldia sp.]
MAFLRFHTRLGEVGRARTAINLAFFNLGVGAGLWAVFIPVVRARVEISEGVLGLALLCIALGLIVAMPATGWAIARYGARNISAFAAAALPVACALPILSPSILTLFLACLAYGAVSGVLDVSMNNEAARVESTTGRALMSSFHGLFSVGGLAGAGIGALLVGLGDPASAIACAVVLALFALAALLVRSWYLPVGDRPAARVKFRLPSRALLLIGILAFLAFGLEGAVADWSALFLEGHKGASHALAATGYAAFAGAMAVMRFLGDRLVTRFGRRRALLFGGSLIAAGCALALLSPWVLLSAAGFGLMGIGAANVVPVLISTAADFPAGSGGISAVATIGYVGSLAWPPAIGGLSQVTGLPMALWLIALAGLAIALASGAVRNR